MVTRKLPKIKVVEASPALGIRVPNVDAVMLIQVAHCIHARVLHWF